MALMVMLWVMRWEMLMVAIRSFLLVRSFRVLAIRLHLDFVALRDLGLVVLTEVRTSLIDAPAPEAVLHRTIVVLQ